MKLSQNFFSEQEVTSKWTHECSLRFILCNRLVVRYSWHPTYWSVTSGLILIMSLATSLQVKANNNPPSHVWSCLTQSGSEEGLIDGSLSVCWRERQSHQCCVQLYEDFTILPIFRNIVNETHHVYVCETLHDFCMILQVAWVTCSDLSVPVGHSTLGNISVQQVSTGLPFLRVFPC